MNVHEIQSAEEWKKLLSQSQAEPVLLLKHSTTCPISANAFKEYRQFSQHETGNHVQYALVKVIESRPISLQIAEDLNVKHASPQIILIKQGKPVWTASHWNITAANIQAAM